MTLLRKIFFYIFVAIYLTVCPLLILRMLGFVRNPQTHQLVKTGIIYVSTNPPGAEVYINNVKAHETTPTIIRDLPPDNYTIRLELKGYQIWQNTVPVVERKATATEDILLIPKQWTIKTLSSTSFDNILSLGDGNTLLLWQEQTIKSLYLLKLNKSSSEDNNSLSETSQVSRVFPPESIYNNARILRFFTIEKSPFFILQIVMGEKQKYLWVDVRDKQIHIEDLSDLLPQEPVRLWWESGDDKIIYAYFNDHINRIDIKAKAIYPDLPQKDIPTIKDTSLNQKDIQGKVFDDNNKLWLEFTNTKIGVWDPSSKSLQWVFQDGNNIRQVFWANNGNTIIFLDGNQIFLLGNQHFVQNKVQKITNIRPDSTIHYSEKTGKLYYLEPFHKLLSSITVLRHKPILPRNIADTLRLKEFEP
ncbi:MAG: PEGA domain-containing protein [Candidatus Omnitrophica bacterium]|nr:PEGA domain-containing protein [Candidatus Omnitrophota bacterium]